MIKTYDEFKQLFEEINDTLKAPVQVYVIGGAVLLQQGLKTATKDIDLVVRTQKEF